jgi:hypothetical protein
LILAFIQLDSLISEWRVGKSKNGNKRGREKIKFSALALTDIQEIDNFNNS